MLISRLDVLSDKTTVGDLIKGKANEGDGWASGLGNVAAEGLHNSLMRGRSMGLMVVAEG